MQPTGLPNDDELFAALLQYGDPRISEEQLGQPVNYPRVGVPQIDQQQAPQPILPSQQMSATSQGMEYFKQLFSEMQNRKEQDNNRMAPVVSLLSQRFQPTMEDAARTVTQNVQSYAPGSGLKPTTLEATSQGRVANELAPYTTSLDLQSKLADINMKQAHANFYGQQGGGGVLMAQAQRLMQENPGMSFTEAFQLAQTGFRQNLKYNPATGKLEPMAGAPEARGQLKEGEQLGAERAKLAYAGPIAAASSRAGAQAKADVDAATAPGIKRDVTKAEATAKTEGEREANFSKAKMALHSFEQQTKNLDSTINEAMNLSDSDLATGWGTFLSGIPNSKAGKLQNILQTIRSNETLNSLQTLKESSPSGGALGQISNFEDQLLAAKNAVLDPKQKDQLKQNLLKLKTLYPIVLKEKKDAFNRDYGKLEGISLDENAPPETSQAVQKWGRDAQGKPVRLQ